MVERNATTRFLDAIMSPRVGQAIAEPVAVGTKIKSARPESTKEGSSWVALMLSGLTRRRVTTGDAG